MKLYNTLTKTIEPITPLNEGVLKVFVCGPTIYDYIHIGNAKTYTQSDMLVRYLRYRGFSVTYLMNITDIDDKIIKRSEERSLDFTELTSTYESAFYEDMTALGNRSVSTYAKATDHIKDIIDQVQKLLEKGHAYVIDDGIYFEIATFAGYGKLSGRVDIQEDDAQTRIDESAQKKGWNDFCLWKFSKPGEPVWDAPFGAGRPGWHIEDTAITEHYFGPQYDIHGGAIDLIFPHHEAEITQMESASGKVPFVGHWFHVGFLTVDDKRMGKSLGNFSTVRDVLSKGYSMSAIRMFFMQAHYRKGLNFAWENLDSAQNRINNWHNIAAMRWQANGESDEPSPVLADSIKKLENLLDNDFDTPGALGIIEEAFSALGDTPSTQDTSNLTNLLRAIDEVFGLNILDSTPDISSSAMQLISDRQTARDSKEWQKSDDIRDELKKHGIAVRDVKNGQVWSYASDALDPEYFCA